jgi:guanylate kinase
MGITVIYGQGGAGKDTIMNYILEKNFLHDMYITDIQQVTTRQPREDEKDDTRHKFITDKEFEEYVQQDNAFAIEIYPNEKDGTTVKYCYLLNQFQDVETKNYIVYGVSLNVAKAFVETFGDELITLIYISTFTQERLLRMVNRAIEENGIAESDTIYEICNRILKDRDQYKDVLEFNESHNGHIVYNSGSLDNAVSGVLGILLYDK